MPAIYPTITPLPPVYRPVPDAALRYFTANPGNPASRRQSFEWEADRTVERARQRIAVHKGAGRPYQNL
jgi:cysteine sulfinate desulfinase/cysteine desulfurase-like protein